MMNDEHRRRLVYSLQSRNGRPIFVTCVSLKLRFHIMSYQLCSDRRGLIDSRRGHSGNLQETLIYYLSTWCTYLKVITTKIGDETITRN
jgi:hypothetical protein